MNRYVEIENLESCQFMQGFYKVPGLPFSVTEGGLVYSYHQGLIPPAFYDLRKVEENKYIHADKQLAHRLVAVTFLKLPEGKTADECLVNHLNGLKYDNRKWNLEWTDHIGNSTHAYQTGLREDNRPVKTLDIMTDVVNHFYSLWDCARFYEINGGRVHGYLNRKDRKVFFLEHYLLVEENEPFPPPKEWTTWRLATGEIHHVLFNNQTKEGFIFRTRKEAFRFIEIPVRAEQKMVKQAIEENRVEMYHQDWVICPLSRFKGDVSGLTDKRSSHEERYANYELKKNLTTGLSSSNV